MPKTISRIVEISTIGAKLAEDRTEKLKLAREIPRYHDIGEFPPNKKMARKIKRKATQFVRVDENLYIRESSIPFAKMCRFPRNSVVMTKIDKEI